MIRNLLICLLTVLATTQAMALELTVERCVQFGLEQNEKLKAMAAEVEISNQDEKIAYADLFPSINLESAYAMRDKPPRFTIRKDLYGPGVPPEDAQIEGEKDHYSVAFKLNQPLFAGGRFMRTHEGKNLLLNAQRYQLEDQKSQLTYQIKESFFHTLINQSVLVGMVETVSTKAEELRVLKELLLVGKATRDESLAAESSLLFAKTDRLKAEQAYQNALDDLGALIGSEEPVTIVEPKLYTTLSPEYEARHDQVFRDRNDMKQLRSQIHAADKNVEVARSRYYPQLNLEASYLKQRETDITEAEIWEAGLRLDWPLFEAGQTNAKVARAKAEASRLKHLRNDLTQTIENETRAAIRLVREKESLVMAHRLQVLAIEQEHANRIEQYRAGEQMELEVFNIRAKLATANANYRAAINQLRIALVSLERVLSAPLDSHLISHEPYHLDLKPLDEILSKPAEVSVPSTVPEQHKVIGTFYAIQMGAFKSTEKAHAYMLSLQKRYPEMAFESISKDDWWKVRATHFTSHETASKALNTLGEKGFIVHAKPDN